MKSGKKFEDEFDRRFSEQCSYCGRATNEINALGYCGIRCTEDAEGPGWRQTLDEAECASAANGASTWKFILVVVAIYIVATQLDRCNRVDPHNPTDLSRPERPPRMPRG